MHNIVSAQWPVHGEVKDPSNDVYRASYDTDIMTEENR